jgi:cyclase
MAMRVVLFVIVSCVFFGNSFAQNRFMPQRKVTRLVEGVDEIQHPDALPDFPEGNTTVIVGDSAVFVVDSGYLPSSTEQDIAQIRQWTNKPVRYLMITHGHTDHDSGNGTYAHEFPSLTIISHRETRNLMARYTPGYPQLFVTRTAQLKTQLETGAGDDGKPLTAESTTELMREVQARDKVGDNFKSMGENPLPGLTFDQGTRSADLGNREVQVKFLGRGNTAGDIVAFLPKEKIAVVATSSCTHCHTPVPGSQWIGLQPSITLQHCNRKLSCLATEK